MIDRRKTYEQRNRDAGLVKLTVWVSRADAAAFRLMAEKSRDAAKSDETETGQD